jgi:large subunit ribosomal protein L43
VAFTVSIPVRGPVIIAYHQIVNDHEKVIGLKGFDVPNVQQKVQLLLDSSGAKIQSLKRKTVVSTTESARGIWSGLHDTPFPI